MSYVSCMKMTFLPPITGCGQWTCNNAKGRLSAAVGCLHVGSHEPGVVPYENIPWNYMAYHGITWYTMELHGIPWNYMVYHGISLDYVALHGKPWYTMTLHGILW